MSFYLFNQENAKTIKGEKLGYLTLILYLAPARSAGVEGVNVCPFATPGCEAACLNTAGRGVYQNVQDARIAKTHALFNNRKAFLDKCATEILNAQYRAHLLGLKLAVRMNGTSDLPFLDLEMARRFPYVQFYGYTKIPPEKDARRKVPNIHLTFSLAETVENRGAAYRALAAGHNVAVVFSTKRDGKLPETWMGYRVIDGDQHDLRFLDKSSEGTDFEGYVVGLRAKGKARHDTSGFVRQVGTGK